jgi:hypothetical protein
MRPSDPTTIKILNDAHVELLRGARRLPPQKRRSPRSN